jgi:hypothetical protein
MKYTLSKIKDKLWWMLISRMKSKQIYPYLYLSVWRTLLPFDEKCKNHVPQYLSARPNPGAGIGHQISNWIAGLHYAGKFNLNFAHLPFSTQNWEELLGLGENVLSVGNLIKQGYRMVKLPNFNEDNTKEIQMIKDIIRVHNGRKVVFVCEQDQFYAQQYGVMEEFREKFYSASARKFDNLRFNKDYYNIAIHVRRGDIVIGQKSQNENLILRWQNKQYFINVLETTLNKLITTKPVAIYLFSQGLKIDFLEFSQFKNIHFCLEMEAQESFIHMVYSDLLITSKSSFSYKPALLNKNTKICPKDFWHGYPATKDWILANVDGTINTEYIL